MSTFKSMREDVSTIQFALWVNSHEEEPYEFITWEALVDMSIAEAIGRENLEIRGILVETNGIKVFLMN